MLLSTVADLLFLGWWCRHKNGLFKLFIFVATYTIYTIALALFIYIFFLEQLLFIIICCDIICVIFEIIISAIVKKLFVVVFVGLSS